jgi:hypothetical protein
MLMSSIISRVAARYKLATDARRLQLAWHTFVSWDLEVLIKDLSTLGQALDSKPLLDKSRYVAVIGESLKKLNLQFTPRLKDLTDISVLRPEIKKAVAPLLRELTRRGRTFNDYDVVEDIDNSPAAKALSEWGRDKLIDAISEMPEEGPTIENLEWLKAFDFHTAKQSLTRIISAIPDLPFSRTEEGSFDYFEDWVHNLPKDWDQWEDSIPTDGGELVSWIFDTDVGKRLNKRLGASKTIFEYIQDDLQNFIEDLEESMEGVG